MDNDDRMLSSSAAWSEGINLDDSAISQGPVETARDVVYHTISAITTACIFGYCYCGNTGIIELILQVKYEKDINSKDDRGMTLLISAARRDAVEFAESLIAQGADVNVKDNELRSPLHFVSSRRMARLLVDHGAEVNTYSAWGDTPLHDVFEPMKSWSTKGIMGEKVTYYDTGLRELVEYLLEQGANVQHKNRQGETPLKVFLDYARDWDLREVTTREVENLLRAHGALE